MQSIDNVPMDLDSVYGITVPQITYERSISQKPSILQPDDLGDLAFEDAVEKAKLGTTIIDGGYLVTGMINASRIDTGTLNADRIATGSITGIKLADGTVTSVKIASIDANKINVGTLTGFTIETSALSNTGVKMSSSLGGLVAYGESIEIRDTSNILYGTIGGYGGYFNLYTSSNRNMRLSAGSGIILVASDFAPSTEGGASYLLGNSSRPWNSIYGGNLVSNNLYAVGSASYIRYFSSAWNFQHKIVAPEVSTPYLTGLNTIRFSSTSTPLTDEGSLYFNGTHLYVRIGGAWKQLDN